MKFRTSTNGFITGIRYYKPATATGTHVGTLWTGTGTKLGTVTFTGETASGWQQATFAAPHRGDRQHDLRRVVLRALAVRRERRLLRQRAPPSAGR